MRQERPITVEVLAYAPVAFFHCLHCELVWEQAGVGSSYRREQLESSIPDDLKQEYQRLSDWVRRMIEVYGSKLEFKIIDVASIEGWIKSLRYRVRTYPAVIVDRKEKTFGADWERAAELIERRLATRSV
jgi:hypothetical protein